MLRLTVEVSLNNQIGAISFKTKELKKKHFDSSQSVITQIQKFSVGWAYFLKFYP